MLRIVSDIEALGGGGSDAITQETTLWVAMDGNDLNPGTEESPFATVNGALSYLADKYISSKAVVTIMLKDGIHNSDIISINHPCSNSIKIQGQNTYPITINSIASGSGTTGNRTIVFNVASTNFDQVSVGDYMIILSATGGMNPGLLPGSYSITAKTATTITVHGMNRMGIPEGTVTATAYVNKSTINFVDVGSYSIAVASGKVGVFSNLNITASGAKTAAVSGAGGSYINLTYVGIYSDTNNMTYGVYTQFGAFALLSSCAISGTSGSGLFNLAGGILQSIACAYTGNAYGVSVQRRSLAHLNSNNVVTGNTNGLYANSGSYIYSTSTNTITLNSYNVSPANNTLGNAQSYIEQL